jgi:twitching motility protein PilT
VKSVDTYLRRTIRLGGSDLHLQVGHRPRIRLQGNLVFAHENARRLDEDDLRELSSKLLDAESIARLEEEGVVDQAYRDESGVHWRVHGFRQLHGSGLALRPLAKEPPTLQELHLPDQLERLADLHSGLILISGQAGSGKTTTLAALLNLINHKLRRSILTLEDPIEYPFESERSIVQQRQVGRDVATFEQGVRDALVERPDVLAIGELRSLETIRLALHAAETGLLVIGTLHAANSAQSLRRLIEVFPANEQGVQSEKLAQTIQAVVCQALLHAKEGRGRYPACELLLRTSAVANLVREGRTHDLRNCIQTGAEMGMVLLDDSLADLLERDLVRVEEAVSYATDPRRLPGAPRPPQRRKKKTPELRSPTERRTERRLATLALANVSEFDEVGFKSELSTGRTANLSPSGAQIQLDHGVLIGARVVATLALDDQVVEAEATVRSSEEHEGRHLIGVHFEKLSEEGSAAIQQYLRLHGS